MKNQNNNIEIQLMQIIYDYYVKSIDCNGIDLYNIPLEYDNIMNNALIRLIKKNKIALIASVHDENPHIIRFGFPTVKEQICYLQSNQLNGSTCLYPTESYLRENQNTLNIIPKYPFKYMIELGYPQLKSCFFEWGVLYKYFSDPRYKFLFSDYIGSIESTDLVDDNCNINLKTFGVGRDGNNNKVVVAFPRDLAHMSYANQIEWYSKLIPNQNQCKILNDYAKNLFEGCWTFPQTVYKSVVQEISNINDLTKEIWESHFFLKDYVDIKPVDFDMIYIPTYKAYMDYVSLLEKIVINNIDAKFFDAIKWKRTEDNGKAKGTLLCLKEWLQTVNPNIKEEITLPLRELRNLRQNPAHKIEENSYDINFLNKQHDLTVRNFEALNLFRRLLQTHPKVKGLNLKYNKTEQYIVP